MFYDEPQVSKNDTEESDSGTDESEEDFGLNDVFIGKMENQPFFVEPSSSADSDRSSNSRLDFEVLVLTQMNGADQEAEEATEGENSLAVDLDIDEVFMRSTCIQPEVSHNMNHNMTHFSHIQLRKKKRAN